MQMKVRSSEIKGVSHFSFKTRTRGKNPSGSHVITQPAQLYRADASSYTSGPLSGVTLSSLIDKNQAAASYNLGNAVDPQGYRVTNTIKYIHNGRDHRDFVTFYPINP